MKKYTLENYEEQLNHQVIHMDQAVCYDPEYLATRKMHDYPSRKLQLARAVYKGELAVNDFIGDLVYSCILSRQGERWQNFRENPEDCTDVFILCRKMLMEKDYKPEAVSAFTKAIREGGGHLRKAPAWDLPTDPAGDMAIFLDDISADAFAAGAQTLAEWLRKREIAFVNEARPYFAGFEYFAYGLVEEGTGHLKGLVEELEKTGAKKVLTVSAQAKYLLTTFAAKLGIEPAFEVVYLPELMERVVPEEYSYVYGGSFNLRYLCNADLLNGLIPNSEEQIDRRSPEFIPLLFSDHRANRLTIWQKPVGAEYEIFGMDPKILEAIEEDGLNEIRKCSAPQVIVFEPAALKVLQEKLTDKKVISYLDLLK